MKAFLIVDMQNDFMPEGALGVAGGDEIIPFINSQMENFPLVVATQDWHPPYHCSFASAHPQKKPGDIVKVDGLDQILWPDHCIRNTFGSDIVSSLNRKPIASYFFKGTDQWIDGYSAFFDNAHKKTTGLSDYLKSRKVTDVYIAGIATDYCVLYSALDALDLGFKVYVFKEGCRGINLKPTDSKDALAAIATRGGNII